jgi:hypothetical protein
MARAMSAIELEKSISDQIPNLPRGNSNEHNTKAALDNANTGPMLRQQLKLWVQTQGIPKKNAMTAMDWSLAKAWAIYPNYLRGWRKNVNPSWDLLGEATDADADVLGTAEAASDADPSGAAVVTREPIVDKEELVKLINATVQVLVGEELAKAEITKISDTARATIKALATTTAREVLAEALPPRKIEIVNRAAGTSKDMGLQHFMFEELLQTLSAKDHRGFAPNVWLTGPTGSGKSTGAENCFKAMSLEFEAEGSLDADYKLMGHMDANGKYVETAFFRKFTRGGGMILDEIDNYGPSALLALNAATANHYCQFPCGLFERHKDFYLIACANTWGLGATNDYVGRNKLDGATLDRWQPKLFWGYDEKLEAAIAYAMGGELGRVWHNLIRGARQAASRQGLKIVISPRATYVGIGQLKVGFSMEKVAERTFLAGVSPEQRASLGIDFTQYRAVA